MARMKFLCDAERCIECNACVTACKNEHEVPWGINRRRVVTINDGKPGERSVSVACMHCSDAPCAAVCPVDSVLRKESCRSVPRCARPKLCSPVTATTCPRSIANALWPVVSAPALGAGARLTVRRVPKSVWGKMISFFPSTHIAKCWGIPVDIFIARDAPNAKFPLLF